MLDKIILNHKRETDLLWQKANGDSFVFLKLMQLEGLDKKLFEQLEEFLMEACKKIVAH